MKLTAVLIACMALLLATCASTSLQSAWYDTSYQGGAFRRVIVVGVGTNATNRRVFEDISAQKLATAGVQGIPGTDSFPMMRAATSPASMRASRSRAPTRCCWCACSALTTSVPGEGPRFSAHRPMRVRETA